MRTADAVMRLQPGRPPVLARGPGSLGRRGVAGSILFEAGSGLRLLDLFPAFWRDEAPLLEWKNHFLIEAEREALLAILAEPTDDNVEEEIMFSRNVLATLVSEVMDDV